MTDPDILKRIGIEPDDLEAFFKKFHNFLGGLNSKEQQIFVHSLQFKSSQEAAAELGSEVKPEDLESLFKRYAPSDGFVCYCCDLLRRPSPSPPPLPPPTSPKKQH